MTGVGDQHREFGDGYPGELIDAMKGDAAHVKDESKANGKGSMRSKNIGFSDSGY